MARAIIVLLCCLTAVSAGVHDALAKDGKRRYSEYSPAEMRDTHSNPLERGESMFQAAAANTVILGWWQFDNADGTPNKQGWTEVDRTEQINVYWHVAGTALGCDDIAPIAGTKSMWCGQWPSVFDPWCSWVSLPGYGNNWDQTFESNGNVATLSYAIVWESEPGYDYTYLEYWDPDNFRWVAEPAAAGGTGAYAGAGSLAESFANPYGNKARFHVVSDGASSDEDGLWPTNEGAVKIDNISINGGIAETFEGIACNATATDQWTATVPPGFGEYGELNPGSSLVQQSPCLRVSSNVWGWFDDPNITSYDCGGWSGQGAVAYGPDVNGLYMDNEIWSPWVWNGGTGSEYILQFSTYRELPLNALIFYKWALRTRDNDPPGNGCPSAWKDFGLLYHGEQKNWIRQSFQVGTLVSESDEEIQIAVGAVDMCGVWGGIYGNCYCHSHTPLIDQVRLLHVGTWGSQWVPRNADMFHDTFPADYTLTGFARCDMAQDIIPNDKTRVLPGDSLKIVVTDPNGLATDNTGGRPGKAVYIFVRCTDRFGCPRFYTGLQMQSPDNKAWISDPNAGLLRWPLVTDITVSPPMGWEVYRMDHVYTTSGGVAKDTYCVDLMDLAEGPNAYGHFNENTLANTGIFRPGDIVWYFLGAKNTLGQWSYVSRGFRGQGSWFRTTEIAQVTESPMEWSVLPDAAGGASFHPYVLYTDDADDQLVRCQLGASWTSISMSLSSSVIPGVQIYVDAGIKLLGIDWLVDRMDILNRFVGMTAFMSNPSLALTCYARLMVAGHTPGDGGTPNGGSGCRKTNDWYAFLEYASTGSVLGRSGIAFVGKDVAEVWNAQVGNSAVWFTATYMNHYLKYGIHTRLLGKYSPIVFSVHLGPQEENSVSQSSESFYAYGGCPEIQGFDVLGQLGQSIVAYRYEDPVNVHAAALFQATPNSVGDTTRVFLGGYDFDAIRDDDTDGIPDYVTHLKAVLELIGGYPVGDPVGIDPVAFENRLDNNYPNPFNPTTTIRYSIAERGHVSLTIFNAAGQLVRTLIDEEQAPRAEGFSVGWDGTNDSGGPVASGVYFYRLEATGFSQTKKLVFLK